MSLTVHCAQCHNHKFDPITQEDYYSLQAVFAAIDRTDRQYDADPKIAAAASGTAAAPLRRSGGVRRGRAAEPMRRSLAGLPSPRVAYSRNDPYRHRHIRRHRRERRQAADHLDFAARRRDTAGLKEVGPGAIAAVPGLDGRFDLPPGHTEGDRRAALAQWLTDRDNPLTWRMIVNRVWQYHFGRGLVERRTTSAGWAAADASGAARLAGRRVPRPPVAQAPQDAAPADRHQRRLPAATASVHRRPQSTQSDADNRYLWRQNRRKLEAEAVRDSILAVAGKLDLTMGGPSFQDFVIEKPEHSPHYQYHLHDPEDPKSHRRAVYRFVVRSKQQPFMAALDCADPSLAVEKRNETLTPLQALALLNNQLTVAMAKHFAARVEKLGNNDDERVIAAVRLALGEVLSDRRTAPP